MAGNAVKEKTDAQSQKPGAEAAPVKGQTMQEILAARKDDREADVSAVTCNDPRVVELKRQMRLKEAMKDLSIPLRGAKMLAGEKVRLEGKVDQLEKQLKQLKADYAELKEQVRAEMKGQAQAGLSIPLRGAKMLAGEKVRVEGKASKLEEDNKFLTSQLKQIGEENQKLADEANRLKDKNAELKRQNSALKHKVPTETESSFRP